MGQFNDMLYVGNDRLTGGQKISWERGRIAQIRPAYQYTSMEVVTKHVIVAGDSEHVKYLVSFWSSFLS